MRISGIDVFPQWAGTIVTYCRETQLKSTAIQGEVSELESDLDTVALLCCVTLLAAMSLVSMLSTSGTVTIYHVILIHVPITEQLALEALCCLSLLLATIKTKKLPQSINFILKVVTVNIFMTTIY